MHTGSLTPGAPLYGSAPIGQLLVNTDIAHVSPGTKHEEEVAASPTLTLKICQWMAKDLTAACVQVIIRLVTELPISLGV